MTNPARIAATTQLGDNPSETIAENPELVVFLLSNLVVFSLGSLLTTLSFLVYHRRDQAPTFRYTTAGFGVITVGGLAEPVYEVAFSHGEQLFRREVLVVQSLEAILFAVGFGLLFYSVVRHNDSRTTRSEPNTSEPFDR